MGPLLALVVIGLVLIGLVGAIFGGLNLVFQTIFTYFPYFVALVILGYLVTKFGGSRGNRMSEAEAGTLGAIGGAAASEIGDRIGGGGGGPDTTPTSPPSSPPSSTGDDSSSSDSGDVDVTVGGDNLSQQQQQQMQQLQEVVLALLEGNLGQGGGGNFVAYGPQQQQQQMLGGLSPGVYSMFMQQISMMQMNQQMLMQQMMQFFMESDYEEINNQFILQFMKQVLDIDIDEGDVSEGDVIVQINQVIQQIDVDVMYQNVQKIIQEINITDETYVEQLMAIIVSLDEGDFEREGDVIIIYAHQEIRIKAATLITFLNILQVVKYWELKQMIIELIELSSENWEVKIENLILIYRESDGEDDDELQGSKWEILERRLKESNLDPNLVEILLDIFLLRDPNQKYGFSPQKVMLLRDRASKVPREDFPDLAAGIINYIEANNVGNINSNTIDSLIKYIENNWPVEPQTHINRNVQSSNDNMAASLEHNVQELIEKIEEEQQIQQEVAQIDDDAIEKLRMALEYYEREKPLLEAIRKLKLPDHHNVSFQQSMKQAMEINQNLSDYDLLDESSITEIRRDTQGMLDNLEKALEDLKQADQDLDQEIQIDSNLEKHISRIEETVQQEMNTSMKRLQSFQAQNNG